MRHEPSKFLNLPVELICHILSFLDTLDLIQCTEVTKSLRKIITDSSRLQFTIELAKHRMVSLLPASAAPSYIARLKILRDRERAWKTLTWNGRYNLQLPPTGSVYEFVGGFYGNGREDDRTTASISFLELPHANPDQLEGLSDLKMWTHPMLDVTIIDFTMDPSQDLLVLIALATSGSGYVYELHLRSLLTNEPHPKAPSSILPCLLKPSHTHQASEHIAAVRVQVSGDLVALLVKEVHDSIGAHLEIWDWINNPQFSCKMARISGIDDFTFLSQNTFLLVRPTGNFEVYTFQNPIKAFDIPICQASYAFPPLSDGYMYWYITMSSNPAPGSIPHFGSNRNATPGAGKQIYYPQPDQRIHACCLYIFNPSTDDHDHRVHCFVFFLNLNTLLNPPADWLRTTKSTYKTLPAHADFTLSNTGADAAPTTASLVPPLKPQAQAMNIPVLSSSLQTTPPHAPAPEYLYYPMSQHINASLNLPSMPFPSSQDPTSSHTIHPFTHYPESPSRSPNSSPNFGTVPIQRPAHVPWSTWGPQNTRWFRECLNTDWQHSIYGLRTVESVTTEKIMSHPTSRTPPTEHPGGSRHVQSRADGSTSISAEVDASGTGLNSTTKLEGGGPEEGVDGEPPIPRRYLRLRDYNPYSVMQENESGRKGKNKMSWEVPRVVVEPSKVNVKGVFKEDITSWLPYVEVISKETFEVTDVMMDDCRLLLLRRGENGRLRRVDVLTM